MQVREAPPLRLSHHIQTPSGRSQRWAADEPDPANVPNGAQFSDTMPGGYESASCSLPRKPGIAYSDLEPLSTWTIYEASGDIVGEYRLEDTPRTSGDQMAVSPNGVGWQAALEDDKSAQMPYVDQDLSHWIEPSAQRQINFYASDETITGATAEADPTTALPILKFNIAGAATAANDAACEAYYDAGAGDIGDVYLNWDGIEAAANITFTAGVADDAELTGSVESADLYGADGADYLSNRITLVPTRWAFVRMRNQGAFTTVRDHVLNVRRLTVYGNHGLTKQGTAPGGLLASDIFAHAVGRWAPALNFTTGANGTIRPSADFFIPHAAFLEPTTVAEIMRQVDRFHLRDWAVWENKTLYYNDRGERGRSWRARVGPSELQETGPSVKRLWESILVSYTDADGTTRTVGPPGSGADAEDAVLKDDDPENPANKLGIVRRDLLSIGTTTLAGATEVGRRFLIESKALDNSGQAKFVGYVEDDRGVVRPYSQVHAGDTVAFVDAADPSPRRIVRAEHTEDDRTCSVDLDAPPEALAALLERLDAQLVRLGL